MLNSTLLVRNTLGSTLSLALSYAFSFALLIPAGAVAAPFEKKTDPEALRKEFLEKVETSDRSVADAQATVLTAVGSARRDLERVAILMKNREEKKVKLGDPILSIVARAFAVLVGAMDQAEKQLEDARSVLREAEQLRAPLDRAMAARYKELSVALTTADRDIETHRKRVQEHWDHFKHPRVASRPEARRAARLKLENLIAIAAAAWHERELTRIKLEAVRKRRRRLTTAAHAISRRLIELDKLGNHIQQFHKALMNPLDGRRPEVTLDKAETWPDPLRKSMELLDEEVALPPPSRPPRHWGLEDRVRRFVSGGSP